MPLVAYPVAAAAIVTSLDGGGFTTRSQTELIVLAAVTLLVAGPQILGALRSPLVLVLGALGALSLLSAAWTIGSASDAARWGLVILSYAVLAAAGSLIATRAGPWPIAIGIAALAAIEAVLGLRAALVHALPDAERIAGTWRPGGSFQYPPALGLLQVAALPVLLSGMARRGWIAVAALAGGVLAGAVIGSAGSRLDLAMAAAILVRAVAFPSPRSWRPRVAMAAGVIALAGLSGHVLVNQRASAAHRSHPPRAAHTRADRTDLTHGRTREWRAAFETWLDRPVAGAGAGAYLIASARHQGSSPVLFAHDLPLELAAELGVLGLLLGLALYASAADVLRRARGRLALWLLGPAVVAFLIANLVDWPWHLAGLGAVWAVAAGGLVAAGSRNT